MPARKSEKKSVRLSSDILPLHYKIHFEPDLDNFTFTGEEEITLDVKKEIKVIKLHSAEIEIFKAEIIQGKNSQTGSVSFLSEDEEVDITFPSEIKKGKAMLKLTFAGILNDKMRGFYRSRYTHADKEYHMGVTQFESTDARRAFPCFDEPEKKAVFNVSFKIPSDRVVISNTLEEEVLEHTGGYKIVKFSESPKMSTYLLAFVIGHFEYVEQFTKDKVRVRVYVTPGKKKQAEFALSTAVKSLEFYTDYFNIPYPLNTLDLIAIPDFAAGAMENWGAVTYRETALLVDEEQTATANKQWVALVIAHELAHQWFGNLVTMEWWTHLWLNEGFASYMEYVAVDHMYPQYHIWTQFVYMDHSHALDLDGLKNTHPIEVPVNHPAEISEIFDEVSYSKGASVIRMLAEYLGYKNFRDGLRAYLKKHSYANAKTEDLWESLEKVSKKPVGKIMKNWTGKPGFPLISVREQGSSLVVFQKRFFSSVFSQKTKDTTTWMVPLDQELISKKMQKIQVKNKDWVKLNKNETSFTRIHYSTELLEKLKLPISKLDKNLSEQDRFGIIRDLFVLSESGFSSTDQYLNLVSSYKNEKSYIVWAQIATQLYTLNNLLYGQPFYESYRTFVLNLFSSIYKEVGWEKKKNELHSRTLLRGIVIGVMGRFGDAEVIKKAEELFEKDAVGEKKLDSDIRGIVYVIVSENGTKKEFDMFLKRYKNETFQEEKDRLLRAICAFKKEELIRKAIEFGFSKDVKAQDSFKVLTFVSVNSVGRNLAFKKVKVEWGSIQKKYAGGHLYTRFVKPFGNFTTEKEAKMIETFFKTKNTEGLDRTIAQVLEQVRSNAEWLKRDKEKIQTFLNS